MATSGSLEFSQQQGESTAGQASLVSNNPPDFRKLFAGSDRIAYTEPPNACKYSKEEMLSWYTENPPLPLRLKEISATSEIVSEQPRRPLAFTWTGEDVEDELWRKNNVPLRQNNQGRRHGGETLLGNAADHTGLGLAASEGLHKSLSSLVDHQWGANNHKPGLKATGSEGEPHNWRVGTVSDNLWGPGGGGEGREPTAAQDGSKANDGAHQSLWGKAGGNSAPLSANGNISMAAELPNQMPSLWELGNLSMPQHSNPYPNFAGANQPAPPSLLPFSTASGAGQREAANHTASKAVGSPLAAPGLGNPDRPMVGGESAHWWYVDKEANVQGPFSAELMLTWHLKGTLPATLLLRDNTMSSYVTLAQLMQARGPYPFVSPSPPPPALDAHSLSALLLGSQLPLGNHLGSSTAPPLAGVNANSSYLIGEAWRALQLSNQLGNLPTNQPMAWQHSEVPMHDPRRQMIGQFPGAYQGGGPGPVNVNTAFGQRLGTELLNQSVPLGASMPLGASQSELLSQLSAMQALMATQSSQGISLANGANSLAADMQRGTVTKPHSDWSMGLGSLSSAVIGHDPSRLPTSGAAPGQAFTQPIEKGQPAGTENMPKESLHVSGLELGRSRTAVQPAKNHPNSDDLPDMVVAGENVVGGLEQQQARSLASPPQLRSSLEQTDQVEEPAAMQFDENNWTTEQVSSPGGLWDSPPQETSKPTPTLERTSQPDIESQSHFAAEESTDTADQGWFDAQTGDGGQWEAEEAEAAGGWDDDAADGWGNEVEPDLTEICAQSPGPANQQPPKASVAPWATKTLGMASATEEPIKSLLDIQEEERKRHLAEQARQRERGTEKGDDKGGEKEKENRGEREKVDKKEKGREKEKGKKDTRMTWASNPFVGKSPAVPLAEVQRQETLRSTQPLVQKAPAAKVVEKKAPVSDGQAQPNLLENARWANKQPGQTKQPVALLTEVAPTVPTSGTGKKGKAKPSSTTATKKNATPPLPEPTSTEPATSTKPKPKAEKRRQKKTTKKEKANEPSIASKPIPVSTWTSVVEEYTVKTGDSKQTRAVGLKLNKLAKELDEWCTAEIFSLPNRDKVDIPTYVSFLLEVPNSKEVHELVTEYLGSSPATSRFCSNFVERRLLLDVTLKQIADSRKADAIRPAVPEQRPPARKPSPSVNKAQPVVQSQPPLRVVSANSTNFPLPKKGKSSPGWPALDQPAKPQHEAKKPVNGPGNVEKGAATVANSEGHGKRGKKNKKRQQVDPALLGFSVAEGTRINAGEILTDGT